MKLAKAEVEASAGRQGRKVFRFPVRLLLDKNSIHCLLDAPRLGGTFGHVTSTFTLARLADFADVTWTPNEGRGGNDSDSSRDYKDRGEPKGSGSRGGGGVASGTPLAARARSRAAGTPGGGAGASPSPASATAATSAAASSAHPEGSPAAASTQAGTPGPTGSATSTGAGTGDESLTPLPAVGARGAGAGAGLEGIGMDVAARAPETPAPADFHSDGARLEVLVDFMTVLFHLSVASFFKQVRYRSTHQDLHSRLPPSSLPLSPLAELD